MAEITHGELETLLREQFGHGKFRPSQERIIRTLLEGRDVLAVLPTGAGKSLVFQLVSQLLPGLTLVVSPLIALMKDQVESVRAHGLEAEALHSGMTDSALEASLQSALQGESKLLYVTPERLSQEAFLKSINGVQLSLLVVDEAHCISEWGYDFRPSYLLLGEAAQRLGRPPLLALTATATPWVRSDIIQRLGLRDPQLVVRDIDRPNLFFEVRRVEAEEEDARVLRRLLQEDPDEYPETLSRSLADAMQGSGIVYVRTTKAAEETAEWLREWGIAADYYHGQRKKADRDCVQEAFMAGELRVIAATNAFGLGVDKPDVRFVVHRDVPASVEEYFQQAGRAGRDGEFARCTLIYRPGDLGKAAFLSSSGRVSVEQVSAASNELRRHPDISLSEWISQSELGEARLLRVLELLKRQGVVAEDDGRVRLLQADFNPREISLRDEESRRAYERSRLQMMRGYADLWDCRRKYLLNYFGEETDWETCDCCDNDVRLDRRAPGEPEVEATLFPVGARVEHPVWGAGEVVTAPGDTVTVRFAGGEEHTLAADVVREKQLLRVVSLPSGAERKAGRRPRSLRIGDWVEHPQYGSGTVQRVSDDSITVLFNRYGYHTLDPATWKNGVLRRIRRARAA